MINFNSHNADPELLKYDFFNQLINMSLISNKIYSLYIDEISYIYIGLENPDENIVWQNQAK